MARRKIIRKVRYSPATRRGRIRSPAVTRSITLPIYPRTTVQNVTVRVRIQLSNTDTITGLARNVESATEPFTYLLHDTDKGSSVLKWSLSLGLMHRMAMSIVTRQDHTPIPEDNKFIPLITYSQFRLQWIRLYVPIVETIGDVPYISRVSMKTSQFQPARVGSVQPVIGRTTSLVLKETSNFWHTQDSVSNYGISVAHWYDKPYTEISKKDNTQSVGYLEYSLGYYYTPIDDIKTSTDVLLDATKVVDPVGKAILKGIIGIP